MIFSVIIKAENHGPDLTLWGTGREAGPPFLLTPVERCSG